MKQPAAVDGDGDDVGARQHEVARQPLGKDEHRAAAVVFARRLAQEAREVRRGGLVGAAAALAEEVVRNLAPVPRPLRKVPGRVKGYLGQARQQVRRVLAVVVVDGQVAHRGRRSGQTRNRQTGWSGRASRCTWLAGASQCPGRTHQDVRWRPFCSSCFKHMMKVKESDERMEPNNCSLAAEHCRYIVLLRRTRQT